MNDRTVDYGIDLGTTNSVIARCTPRGPRIIPNRLESEMTPSAVAFTVTGQTIVGQDALDKPDLSPTTQFKRIMGTRNTVSIDGGREISPEQLSAEILKDLKASVQLRYDIQPEHIVITVPAMFQQPQCEATHRAAELAGLDAVALIQEPIAAATAYLSEEPEEGNYLVYDLGGGTFDVSVVCLKDNEMSVRAYGGDNYLGGADLDARLFEWTVDQLEQRFERFPQLSQPKIRPRLLKQCEEARKRLSLNDVTSIDLSDFCLPAAQLNLTRTDLEDLIEPIVTRTIRLAGERLDAIGLRSDDIKCVLLVGGPTRTPYVRHRLKQDLGIRLSFDANPMTVVALGAAIHAGGLLKPAGAAAPRVRTQTEAHLELHYEPTSRERECSLSGRVTAPEAFAGDIRVSRSSGDWDTGWMPLRNGAFFCGLLLGADTVTEFSISLRDAYGTICNTDVSQIDIRYGLASARPIAPYNYGIALEGGVMGPVVEQGKPLPAFGVKTFNAARSVVAGSGEELAIYFLEGHSPAAQDNVKVGELRIKGQDLPRTLREGEKLEIRIHMDESRRLKARVSIPTLDLDFAVEMQSFIDKPPLTDLKAAIYETQSIVNDFNDLKSKGELEFEEVDHQSMLRSSRELEQLEAEVIGADRGAIDEPERLAKKIAEVKADVRALSQTYGIKTQYQRTVQDIGDTESICREFGDSLGLAIVDELRTDAEKSLRNKDARGMTAVKARADDLFWKHYVNTERCWVEWIEFLRSQRELATDTKLFHEYLRSAEDCMRNDDKRGVRWNIARAMEFLPGREVRLDRFYDAGLRRI